MKDPIIEHILDSAFAQAELMRSAHSNGARGVEIRLNPALIALKHQYRKAQDDPAARVPTALSLAIEAVLALMPAPAPRPKWEREAATGARDEYGTSCDGRSL